MTNTVISKARSEVEEKIHDAMEAAMAAGEQGEECVKGTPGNEKRNLLRGFSLLI